jgi:hypothetical protein
VLGPGVAAAIVVIVPHVPRRSGLNQSIAARAEDGAGLNDGFEHSAAALMLGAVSPRSRSSESHPDFEISLRHRYRLEDRRLRYCGTSFMRSS